MTLTLVPSSKTFICYQLTKAMVLSQRRSKGELDTISTGFPGDYLVVDKFLNSEIVTEVEFERYFKEGVKKKT